MSEPEPDGGEPAEVEDAPQAPVARSRRRLMVTTGLLVLLCVLIAVVPRHSTLSKTFPPGRWGGTIACLEHLQSYQVTDARTGAVPGAHTTVIDVSSVQLRHLLVRMRDTGDPAAARAVASHHRLAGASLTDYRTIGPVVWAYAEHGTPPQVSANAGDRTLISFCVTHPHHR